jgi:hypothetical protein
MVSAIALTFFELTGCGKVATAASIASSMRPIVSGGKDAFEKSFIRSVLVPQGVMEPTRPIELVHRCTRHQSYGTKIVPALVQTIGRPALNQCLPDGLVLRGKQIRLDYDMQNRIVRIDPTHGRAISTEVAERLRMILAKEPSELPSSLKNLIHRLPELDEDSPSIVP